MTVQDYIIQQCKAEGLTEEAIAALMAQIQAESAFIPNNLEDTANRKLGMTDEQYTQAVDNGSYTNFIRDGAGYGLFQVTFWSRKEIFLDYVRSRGGSIGSCELQVGFMFWEFKGYFASIWNQMHTSHDLEGLTEVLLRKWENPANQEQALVTRLKYAREWYDKIKNGAGGNSGMTQEEAIKKVLDLARSEIGYHEQGDNVTKYAADLDAISGFYNGKKNGYAWCDVFVDWLFVKSFGAEIGRQMVCQPMQSAGAGCLYSAQYYRNAGRWTNDPQPGDQIFFSYAAGEYSHTGIVESADGGQVVTIEGNTSDQVARRSYSSGSGNIAGYGRPRWELATGSSSGDIVPSGGGSSTRILKRGYTGDDVRELQENLQKLGYDIGRWGADGDFGNDTYSAVVGFQRDHGLEADGEAGPLTLKAIQAALKEPDDESETPDTPPEEKDDTLSFEVGDIVNFTGTVCYQTNAGTGKVDCKPGRALVIEVSPAGQHHYCLCKINGYGSSVYGWVETDDVRPVVT